ncbi:MAG TPA: hypothetical protein VMU77_03500, partial [Acidimicrobiales bacterium]|nr:hypothetical protein [Acidimicrobiales bacterium]
MGSSLGRVIVGPTAALAGKLKLAGKALIVITLLLIPLGVVLADYVGQQNSQISTTNQEKSGVVYLTSVDQLMNAVVVSRDATMSG